MSEEKDITAKHYGELLIEVKERIRAAQYEALKHVNRELVGMYWDIGRLIVERQNEAGWGKSIVEMLSKDLQNEFPGIKGFSVQNLWYMRQFFLEYFNDKKLQPLVGEISWTHNLIIIQRCKDPLEREFYIKMTRKFGWSKNILIHQIDKNRTTVEYALSCWNRPDKQAKRPKNDPKTIDKGPNLDKPEPNT